MKLLFDENLSPKLPRLVTTLFPDSLHLRDCGLKGATDEEIWEWRNAFTLVSKDSDFYQRSLFYGSPPKFVGFASAIAHAMTWLRYSQPTSNRFSRLMPIQLNQCWSYPNSEWLDTLRRRPSHSRGRSYSS